jgi:hypothetical protein
MTSPSVTHRLLIKEPPVFGDSNTYFYVVTERDAEKDGKVFWLAEVRQGIYPQTARPQIFRDKSALEQEIKTKELDGYLLVSDTNYSSTLDNNWLIEMGLRKLPEK